VNLSNYKNELIVMVSILIMGATYLYKNDQSTVQVEANKNVYKSLEEVKEVIALKKLWKNKKTLKKLDKIRRSMSSTKVKWEKKGKKVVASFEGLTNVELNKLTTLILNTAVEITLLDIKKVGLRYDVEFKCKY